MEQFLAMSDLQSLLDGLIARGYRVVGPTVQQEAIVYDDITRV